MCFLRLWKENTAANTQTRHILETVIITYKEQKASTTPESAAQALDGVGLD